MTQHDLRDLGGITDIASMAGVGKAAVANWRIRHDDFPLPLVIISKSIPVFSKREVAQWLVDHGKNLV